VEPVFGIHLHADVSNFSGLGVDIERASDLTTKIILTTYQNALEFTFCYANNGTVLKPNFGDTQSFICEDRLEHVRPPNTPVAPGDPSNTYTTINPRVAHVVSDTTANV
jgi:hypothetical protein